MASIPPTPPPTQEQQPFPHFQYALRLTAEQVKSLPAEQLLEVTLEYMNLFGMIRAVLYNPVAKEATRLLALDVILTQVGRATRKLISSVTDKSPTYAPETQKRLGLSKNTISTGYKTLEKAGCLARTYRTDEITRQEHLDIQPTAALFTTPEVIRDKKKRAAPRPKRVVHPLDLTKRCLSCGSPNVRVTCRECGSSIDLGDVAPRETPEDEPKETEPITTCMLTAESEAGPTGGTALQNEVLEELQEIHPLTPPQVDTEQLPTPSPEEDQKTATHHKIWDDSTTPSTVTTCGTASPLTPPQQAPQDIVLPWLEQRIGDGQLIYATGQPAQDEKYKTLPPGYRPDLAAYLRGHPRHIYGSRLGTGETTMVLGFDVDDPELDAKKESYLQPLQEAGAFPLYWHRRSGRGHLEVYFSEPVKARAAYQ